MNKKQKAYVAASEAASAALAEFTAESEDSLLSLRREIGLLRFLTSEAVKAGNAPLARDLALATAQVMKTWRVEATRMGLLMSQSVASSLAAAIGENVHEAMEQAGIPEYQRIEASDILRRLNAESLEKFRRIAAESTAA